METVADFEVSPLPPWSNEFIGLAENLPKIYGAEQLRGKILISKSLIVKIEASVSKMERRSKLSRCLGLDDDRAFGMSDARSDVTTMVWKSCDVAALVEN
jgi:hypothetical protein